MSAYSYALSVYPQMHGVKEAAPIRTKAKIEFAEFVSPDSYWPQPYTLEQAFQVYRWLIRTAKPHTEWGGYNPFDILIGRGVMGSTDCESVCSLGQLRKVFHRAILGRSNGVQTNTWRKQERIEFGQSRIIQFPHYLPFAGTPLLGRIHSEAQIKALIEAYFNTSGNLVVQLNSAYADAIEIQQLVIGVSTFAPSNFEFRFDLAYGVDGSSWSHRLATGVQFMDTFGVALQELERVSGQNLTEGK